LKGDLGGFLSRYSPFEGGKGDFSQDIPPLKGARGISLKVFPL